jgi:hypothetical protein
VEIVLNMKSQNKAKPTVRRGRTAMRLSSPEDLIYFREELTAKKVTYFRKKEGLVMLTARSAVLCGLMLLLVSGILTLQVASAREVAPGLPEVAFGQPLPDSLLKDLSGKASLVNFENGFTDMVVQSNSGGGNQVNTANVFSTHTTQSGTGLPNPKRTPFDAYTATQFWTIFKK